MQRVNITQPFSFNLTGYAEKPAEYAVGEQDVPAAVAAWLSENPEYGSTVVNEGDQVPEGGVGEVSADGARVLPEDEAAAVEFPEGDLEGEPEPEQPAEEVPKRSRKTK